MHIDQRRERIGHQGSAMTRARQIALKALLVIGGAVTLVSAFVLSLVFVAIGLAFVLTVGGFLWWQTRGLRRDMRERIQAARQPAPIGEVIEGEFVTREEAPRR